MRIKIQLKTNGRLLEMMTSLLANYTKMKLTGVTYPRTSPTVILFVFLQNVL